MQTEIQNKHDHSELDKSSRTWIAKFREAGYGLFYGMSTEKTFRFQVPAAFACIALSVYLKLPAVEWCLVLLSIGIVLTAEMFNTAIEYLFHGLDEKTKETWNPCLILASGGVLMTGIFALSVGAIIFGRRLLELVPAN